ncbi:MAG: squalene-associated FAD-dependent desaturase [Janthinobacterium sp.]
MASVFKGAIGKLRAGLGFKSGARSSAAVAVIGGGWAGCAAAVELASAGHKVTLFEASRTLGGRARAVNGGARTLDNGQHILLGAYGDTLRLLARVGIDHRQAFLRLPLQMRYPPDSGGMDFVAPRLPAPLHLVGALLGSKGLDMADKMSLARFSSTARWMGWQLNVDCSVAQLLQRWDQSERMIKLMWRPLCLAALNTPLERASAKVFLNVLRDSLGAKRAASDMLIPRMDLSTLFPVSAAAFVERHGGEVRTGAQITCLQPDANQRWHLTVGADANGERSAGFDGVVLASNCRQAATLLGRIEAPSGQARTVFDAQAKPAAGPVAASSADAAQTDEQLRAQVVMQIDALEMEAITTCYLQYGADVRLERAFFALQDDPELGHWGQFVFDRGHLDDASKGLLAVIVSASGACASLDRALLAQTIARQLAGVLRRPVLEHPLWVQVINEKRATFACTAALVRPGNATGWSGLALAGDYTASDYPATIEAAIRSGVQAAAGLWRTV